MAKIVKTAVVLIEHEHVHILQIRADCWPSLAYSFGTLSGSPASPSSPVGVGMAPNFGYILMFGCNALIGNCNLYVGDGFIFCSQCASLRVIIL